MQLEPDRLSVHRIGIDAPDIRQGVDDSQPPPVWVSDARDRHLGRVIVVVADINPNGAIDSLYEQLTGRAHMHDDVRDHFRRQQFGGIDHGGVDFSRLQDGANKVPGRARRCSIGSEQGDSFDTRDLPSPRRLVTGKRWGGRGERPKAIDDLAALGRRYLFEAVGGLSSAPTGSSISVRSTSSHRRATLIRSDKIWA